MIGKLLTASLIVLFSHSCALLDKNKQDSRNSNKVLNNDYLPGIWVDSENVKEVREFFHFTDTGFTQVAVEAQKVNCSSATLYSWKSGRISDISKESEAENILFVVNELEPSKMILLKNDSSEEWNYSKVTQGKWASLARELNWPEVCGSFPKLIKEGSGEEGETKPFQPEIGLGIGFTRLSTNEAKIAKDLTDSGIGYLRFALEDGVAFKISEAPKKKSFCELSFLNIGQIAESADSFDIPAALVFKVIRSSQSRTTDGFPSIDILFDGMNLRCVNPQQTSTISRADISKALGVYFSFQ